MTRPLVAYLDLNHLVSLAKAHQQDSLSLEQRLIKLVNSGRLILPVSVVHIMEISAVGSERQRQDLAAMIRTLSQGFVLRPLDAVRHYEVSFLVARHYGCTSPAPEPSQIAIAHGYVKAIGELDIDFSPWQALDPTKAEVAEKEVWAALGSDAIICDILSLYQAKPARGGPEQNELNRQLRETRLLNDGKSLQQMEEECISGSNREFVAHVFEACKELSLGESAMLANPPKHFWSTEFMTENLPTWNVWARLYAYFVSNQQFTMKINHLYDMGHLAVAVPYCDVVVCDKEMAHHLNARGLAAKYGTQVFYRLDAAVEHLERAARAGCVEPDGGLR
jgi:hypothetical protein